jgi:hypothetical protein
LIAPVTGAAPVSKPVKLPELMIVSLERRKSSAASISAPEPDGREAVAIRPSGVPVVKE